MSIPVHCNQCGYRGIARSISVQDTFNFSVAGSEQCPQCGGPAEFQQGSYDFIGDVLMAFRAPGMTREKVEAAKQVVGDASAGVIASDVALQRLGEISAQLATLIEKSGERRINWGLILTIVLAIYTIWTDQKSDADAQAALAEARTQSEVAQKTLEVLERQSAVGGKSPTKPTLRSPAQPQTTAPKNRHQRRADAAKAGRSDR